MRKVVVPSEDGASDSVSEVQESLLGYSEGVDETGPISHRSGP